jgi:glycosyltransferase involved in cell wall biosynthesis
MKTLYLFTGSYPYSVAAEDTFVPQELAVLRHHFRRIVLVPIVARGTRATVDVPGVEVDTSFAELAGPRWRQLLSVAGSLGDTAFLRELVDVVRLGRGRPSPLVRLALHQAMASLAERWMRRRIAANGAEPGILYTWWFDGVTLGLARAARGHGIPVVTRAHGFDLYESRYDPPYIPFRRTAIADVAAVFPDSSAGTRYLAERHPSHAARIQAGLLGVEDPGFTNPASSDGVFRLMSCSFIRPVKRIDLIIRALGELGRQQPGHRFHWTHVGNGRDRESLVELAARTVPANVGVEFRDYPGKDQLFQYYRGTPVDLFLNVSESEGTPVSIMEAISVGIPILATAVGGNTEIVAEENGMLVSPNPEPGEIAAAVGSLLRDPARLAGLRAGSRARWEREYNAQRNYDTFARIIDAL